MKKEVKKAALKKITSHNEKYNLTGENKLTSCLNQFDKVIKDGVIIDDNGIIVNCPYCDEKNLCIYEKCPHYKDYLAYLTLLAKQK